MDLLGLDFNIVFIIEINKTLLIVCKKLIY